jgi:2-polyprenyl-3-methyl-5-hydroxy-6-metoxy-1,4-benzoquinol methylase
LYIDVLEHVEDDKQELETAASLLAPGGHLVVLSPAHQWLFSEFDQRIGHYRRYSREALNTRVPPHLTVCILRYLDTAGVFASLANKVLLRQATPSMQQVRFWDRLLVPLSRRIDNKIAFRFGKSILGVWRSP